MPPPPEENSTGSTRTEGTKTTKLCAAMGRKGDRRLVGAKLDLCHWRKSNLKGPAAHPGMLIDSC